jgi:hypothetical protein
MCPTYPMMTDLGELPAVPWANEGPEPGHEAGPSPAAVAEPEAALTEQEWEYLASVQESAAEQEQDRHEWEAQEWEDREWEDALGTELLDGEQDPGVLDLAEKVAARSALREVEEERPRRAPTRTSCFTAAEAAAVVDLYRDNDVTGDATSFDRASCIVMLNVGVGLLLGLRTKEHPARTFKPATMSRRPRTVTMGDLTTHSIESAMAQLVRSGRATGPLLVRFTDSRGRRAGTLAPQAMQNSLLDAITTRTTDTGCWYAFGLSLLDGYHSVMLLVDHTGPSRKIWWMDQFSRGLDRDVTTTLDAEVTSYTTTAWQSVKDRKGVGFDTTARLWRLWNRT